MSAERGFLQTLSSRRFRPGIRGKILLCFAILLAFFLVLTLIMQSETMKLSKEYSLNLSNYLLAHRFRLDLTAFHEQADRYLREPGSVDIDSVYKGIGALTTQYAKLIPLQDISIPVMFEVRATGYGLDAYLPLVSKAVGLRAGGSADYYQIFVKATRIQGFIDIYLNRLLSGLMKSGEDTYQALSSRSEILNRTILIFMILASILALIVIVFVTEAITSPLRRLAKEAEKLARGDLDAGIVEAHTRDEIETLTRSFASMAKSIKEMVEGLKEKAELERLLHEEELALVSMGKSLREAQFLNLQEQMKPHFLFNALNTIARSAMFENAARTESLAMGLAALLRATIKETGPLSSLDDEVLLARSYLEFQHARFGSRLRWNIDVPATLKSAKIPRLLIQPLVENAVRHAIEPKIDGGTVRIRVRTRRGYLLLWVVDDGIGMSKERLREVRKTIETAVAQRSYSGPENQPPATPVPAPVPTDRESAEARPEGSEDRLLVGTGIGLANLATRLGILYAEQARFIIQSREGRGTFLRLKIPFEVVEE